jgi:hypothetical protein
MEMTEQFQFDLFFYACILFSLLVGRFLGRISGYRQRIREEENEVEEFDREILVCNVTHRSENGTDVYYDLVTDKFIRSGVTAEELHEILQEQNPDKEVRLVISRES